MSRSILALILGLVVWLSAAVAHAGQLDISLVEADGAVTVQIRGIKGTVPNKKPIITSKTGALLFLDGQRVDPKRIKPAGRHRLHYVQVGRSGDRAAIRLAQSSRARGSLSKFLEQTQVDGGIDIKVIDKTVSTAEPAPEPVAEADAETDEPDAEARAATIAALEETLGAGADPGPADPEPTVPPTEPEPEQAQEAAEAPAPAIVGATDDKPIPELGGKTKNSTSLWVVAFGAAVALAGWAIWRRRRATSLPAAETLRIVSRVGIGARQQVVLIDIGGRRLLLGSTDQRVALLKDLSAGASMDQHVGTAVPQPPPMAEPEVARVQAFKARLSQALGRELKGEGSEFAEPIPPHLRLLQRDPAWAQGEDAA